MTALATAPRMRALDPALRISQYHKQYWQVEQGLPHSYVSAIRQSRGGHLLVGTDEGLARFDGVSFSTVPAEPAARLSRRWISALLTARDGALWVGTFDGWLLRLRDGRIEFSENVRDSIFDLIEDSGSVVWAGTRNGLLRWDGRSFSRQRDLDPPGETSWNLLSTDTRDGLWLVTSQGLFERRGGSFQRRLLNSPVHGEILTVRGARSGGLWLGTSKGAYRLAAGDRALPVPLPGVPGPVVALLEDHDGTLWAGTWGNGIHRITDGAAEPWTARDGLPDDFIRTLAEDSEGNLWIGMRSGGLGRWRETRLIPLGTPEGLAGNYATVVATDPAGRLWLGTWRGGFYRLDGGALESQPVPLPTLYFTVRALAFDRLGRQWIGNWEGLFQFDGTGYKHYAAESDSPYRRVSALLFDRRGGMWVGTAGSGLYAFPEGRPALPAPAPLLPNGEITTLLEASDGAVWIGTSNGVYRLRPGQTPEPWPKLPQDSIETLFEDSRRRVWASTAGGSLMVFSAPGERVLDRRAGLPEHALYRVLEDLEGNFWVSSPRGILELSAESVEQVLAGRARTLSIVTHGTDDGMRTIECHGLSQPAGWRGRDGSLWFPTAKGFIQVRGERPRQMPAPRAVIEAVATEGGGVEVLPRIELRPGARNIEVRFTALRLSSPAGVRFRYRMTGFDPDWVDGGSQRSARYNQLPPGLHRFEVQARDPKGEWGAPASMQLNQLPRFYQTWWFYLLAGALVLAAAAAAYRWRLHAVRGRYAAVLEERNRIGREWHDTLVAGFSAISLQLEAALASLSSQPQRAAGILDVTRRMVHHYRAEARRVIWDLRDNRPEGETLPMAVETALRGITANLGIAGRVEVEGQPVELPVELQHNVLRICQEAISNSARHARPARIDVDIVYAPTLLKAAVRDDGCGFNAGAKPGETAGHFGLTVMQERARRHGGSLEVESRPGSGTTVTVLIPLAGRGGH